MKLLFICSRNKWRSRTAEKIFRSQQGIEVRSAGVRKDARVRVSPQMLAWADVVVVMERKHANILKAQFPQAMRVQEYVVLGIPDDYPYMDPELVELLWRKCEEHGLLDADEAID